MCCFDRRERRKARFASKSFEGDGAMRTGSTPLLATASRPFLARLVILLDSRRLCAAPSRPRDDCLQAVDAPILRDNSFFSSSFFARSLTCGLPLLSHSTALPLLPLSLSLSLFQVSAARTTTTTIPPPRRREEKKQARLLPLPPPPRAAASSAAPAPAPAPLRPAPLLRRRSQPPTPQPSSRPGPPLLLHPPTPNTRL